jgi:hypothetical protein
VENEAQVTRDSEPWRPHGYFVSDEDEEVAAGFPMHAACYNTMHLRLAVYHGAPLAVQEEIAQKGAEGGNGLPFETEWNFLAGIVAVRSRNNRTGIASIISFLRDRHRGGIYLDDVLTYSARLCVPLPHTGSPRCCV